MDEELKTKIKRYFSRRNVKICPESYETRIVTFYVTGGKHRGLAFGMANNSYLTPEETWRTFKSLTSRPKTQKRRWSKEEQYFLVEQIFAGKDFKYVGDYLQKSPSACRKKFLRIVEKTKK